jgi:uncharacterized protein (DUF1778 family)
MSKLLEEDIPERKTQQINLKLTRRQKQIIDNNAKKMGLNRSDYLIARATKRPHTRANEILAPDYVNLMLNLRELRAQGNNLNQLTRALHVAKLRGDLIIVDETQLQATLEANLQARQAILNVTNGK